MATFSRPSAAKSLKAWTASDRESIAAPRPPCPVALTAKPSDVEPGDRPYDIGGSRWWTVSTTDEVGQSTGLFRALTGAWRHRNLRPTHHAVQQMAARGITLDEVAEALENPETTYPSSRRDDRLTHSRPDQQGPPLEGRCASSGT